MLCDPEEHDAGLLDALLDLVGDGIAKGNAVFVEPDGQIHPIEQRDDLFDLRLIQRGVAEKDHLFPAKGSHTVAFLLQDPDLREEKEVLHDGGNTVLIQQRGRVEAPVCHGPHDIPRGQVLPLPQSSVLQKTEHPVQMLLLGAVVAHCDEKFQIVRVVVDEQGEHLE